MRFWRTTGRAKSGSEERGVTNRTAKAQALTWANGEATGTEEAGLPRSPLVQHRCHPHHRGGRGAAPRPGGFPAPDPESPSAEASAVPSAVPSTVASAETSAGASAEAWPAQASPLCSGDFGPAGQVRRRKVCWVAERRTTRESAPHAPGQFPRSGAPTRGAPPGLRPDRSSDPSLPSRPGARQADLPAFGPRAAPPLFPFRLHLLHLQAVEIRRRTASSPGRKKRLEPADT